MRIRFLRLTTLYPAFERQFLAANPDWHSLSHDTLLQRLLAERFAESNYHALHLRRLGHDAETRFLSCEPLQRRWAAERGAGRGIVWESTSWQLDVALAQVRDFKPDVLWLDDLYLTDQPFRARLRQNCHPGTLFVGWRAAPTEDFGEFRDLDLMLTSIRGLAEQFEAAGVPVELVHHGFETSVLEACPPASDRQIPFSFAGGVTSLHPQRARLVETLLARTPLQVWGADPPRRFRERVACFAARWGIGWGRKAQLRRLLTRYPDRLHRSIFGREYYGILGQSQLVFNSHISCSSRDASNMRLFEATGMGACLLTDWKPNLQDLFEPDVEVATYRTPDECVDKARYLLTHDAERHAIAAAGQRRTLRDHTFARRVETLEQILLRRLRAIPKGQAA